MRDGVWGIGEAGWALGSGASYGLRVTSCQQLCTLAWEVKIEFMATDRYLAHGLVTVAPLTVRWHATSVPCPIEPRRLRVTAL